MQLLIIVILLQEWASGILAQNKKNFLDYCSANMKDVSPPRFFPNCDDGSLLGKKHYACVWWR